MAFFRRNAIRTIFATNSLVVYEKEAVGSILCNSSRLNEKADVNVII